MGIGHSLSCLPPNFSDSRWKTIHAEDGPTAIDKNLQRWDEIGDPNQKCKQTLLGSDSRLCGLHQRLGH